MVCFTYWREDRGFRLSVEKANMPQSLARQVHALAIFFGNRWAAGRRPFFFGEYFGVLIIAPDLQPLLWLILRFTDRRRA